MGFPLRAVPSESFQQGSPRNVHFGARRAHGRRKHAAADLLCADGDEVLAVADGEVIRGAYLFRPFTRGGKKGWVYAIDVRHVLPNGKSFIVRYGEIKRKGAAKKGATVKEGDVVGYAGKMASSTMLHFEMYTGREGFLTGRAQKPLSNKKNKPYERRRDLMDPTPFLNCWAKQLEGEPCDITTLPIISIEEMTALKKTADAAIRTGGQLVEDAMSAATSPFRRVIRSLTRGSLGSSP